MSRINFFVSSMVAQRLVTGNTRQLAASLERLSTGYRINRGGDDPAGLLASESMRGDLRGISAALSNAERAEQVVNIAEGGLQEVSSMLVEVQGLVAATANDSATRSGARSGGIFARATVSGSWSQR
jgi:flagellin